MKGVHSQPLLLFLCWFMAWGGLKRLLIFILLRQTAFGIKGQGERGSKGKGGRAAEVQKTRLEMGSVSALGHKGKCSIKAQPCDSLVPNVIQECRSFQAGLCASEHARQCLHGHGKNTPRCVCRGKGRHGDLGRAQCARIWQVHKRR